MNSKRFALEIIYEKEQINKDWFDSLVNSLDNDEKLGEAFILRH